MTRRFGSVRAKFTLLVGLPVLLVLAVFPFISRVMERQLARQADERINEARDAFQDEIDDATNQILVTAHALAENGDLRRALAARDGAAAQAVGQSFVTVFPDNDVLFAASDGTVLAKLGPSPAPDKLTDLNDLVDYRRGEMRGIATHGCAKPGTRTSSARFIALDVGDAGSVVVCQMLGHRYVGKIAAKLGMELSILDAAHDDKVIVASKQFPANLVHLAHAVPERYQDAGRDWVVARFEPRLHVRARGKLGVVLARDVTDIRVTIRRQLYWVTGMLLLAAAFSLAIGSRLAIVMSRALGRVGDALKKLEHQEYVKVEGIKTGDELEDLADGFNQMVDGLKERDKLRTTFGKYMTEAVVEHLMAGKVTLGGESLTVTILFSDIRSFTSISEKMDAQALVGLLNEYFTEMVSIVMQHDGVVDKYIGDAIMAVFGAPVPRPDDAKNAVRAAVRMREALARLNEKLVARGVAPLATGIGLHTGEVVAGNIGSEQRMEYTVIGDAVNLASRLEGSTKDFHVGVVMSQATYELTQDVVETRPLKEIVVKGRAEAVMTYEAVRLKGESGREE
jgi:adenylate cyclase